MVMTNPPHPFLIPLTLFHTPYRPLHLLYLALDYYVFLRSYNVFHCTPIDLMFTTQLLKLLTYLQYLSPCSPISCYAIIDPFLHTPLHHRLCFIAQKYRIRDSVVYNISPSVRTAYSLPSYSNRTENNDKSHYSRYPCAFAEKK